MTKSLPHTVISMALSLCVAGCLEARVDDDVPPSLILPAGSIVPSIYSDPAAVELGLGEQIRENDQVDDLIPLVTSFQGGDFMRYWDLGEAPTNAAPIFATFRRNAGGGMDFFPINIVDSIPGDPKYSPFWAVFLVEVTEQYEGQVFTSVAALQEAQEVGLVHPPVKVGVYSNCPIVHEDVRLEVGGGIQPLDPIPVYVGGYEAKYFDFARSLHNLRFLEADGISVPVRDLFELRREGGVPLSEIARNVDMTGDGDINDTNNIVISPLLACDPTQDQDCCAGPGCCEGVSGACTSSIDTNYSPLKRKISVTVRSDYTSIEGNLNNADFKSASDLFVNPESDPRSAILSNVVAWEVADEPLRNIATQSKPGEM